MKPRSAIACFFAAYGVYLVIFHLINAIGIAIAMTSKTYLDFVLSTIWQQALAVGIPLTIGILLLSLAGRLGKFTALKARLESDELWTIGINAHELCAILLCCTAAWLIISNSAALLQNCVLFFLAHAGPQKIGFQAALQMNPVIISNIVGLAGGLVLLKKCRPISASLGFRGANP